MAATLLKTFETRNLNQNQCVICRNDKHELTRCPDFLKANVKKRWDLTQKYHACFSCLKHHRGCRRIHHKLLHKPINQFAKADTVDVDNVKKNAILKMLSVQVRGPKGIGNIVAFIDDGNNVTLLDSTVAEKIGATGQQVPLCYNLSAGISRYDDRSEKVSINISKNCNEYPTFTMRNIRTMENLPEI
jgi:hypothetical protein